MGDESRHYRTDRPGESSIGYARNERERPFGKRDGWLGPPGYSRGGHPPAPFTHRRGRFEGPHVGSRDYLGPDRLQPSRPSFQQGRGVPPPFHYSPAGPRRGHGPYGGPGVERARPYHLNEPRGPVYTPDTFGPVPGRPGAHREPPPHDWDNIGREGPSAWEGERDPPPPDWSRGVAIQPSGLLSAVRAQVRPPQRYAVLDVEAGELPSDGVRPVKTSQWDKGGPLQRAPLPSPTPLAPNHVRPIKLLGPFTPSSLIVETQVPQEQPALPEPETRVPPAVDEQTLTAVDAEQIVQPIPDVKLEPRNSESKVHAEAKQAGTISEEGSEKGKIDGTDGEFPSPAPAAGSAADEHPRTSRRRGWGQGLKRLSSVTVTNAKTENRHEDMSGAVLSSEDAERFSEQGPGFEAAPSADATDVGATGDALNAVLLTEGSDGGGKPVAPVLSPDAGLPSVLDGIEGAAGPAGQAVAILEHNVEGPPSKKAQILSSIEGVDGELSDLEKQLAALNNKIAELVAEEQLVAAHTEELAQPVEFKVEEEVDINVEDMEVSDSEPSGIVGTSSEQVSVHQDEVKDAEPNEQHSLDCQTSHLHGQEEVTWQSVVQQVLDENKAAAGQTHSLMAALSGAGDKADDSTELQGTRQPIQPGDAESQARLDKLVRQFLLERHQLVAMKQKALANEYLAQEEQYVASFGTEPAVAASLSRPHHEPNTRSTRSHHTSDTLRSELDYKNFLQRKQAVSELEDMSKAPDQLLDPWQKRWNSFSCKNNLVEDPVKELDDDKLYKENWSTMEKRLFRELFLLHPKDFGSISEHLGTRTTAECVVFFYKAQKLDEFAAVRRKQQLKKRRLQCESKRHAVPLVYAPTAKASLDARGRGRGRAGGRGRGKGATTIEVPAAEHEDSEAKHPHRFGVVKLEREESFAGEDSNGLVKEAPSDVYIDTIRTGMSPTSHRSSLELPKSSFSPTAHRSVPEHPKSSPSGLKSPGEVARSGSGFWTSLGQKTSIDQPNSSNTHPTGSHKGGLETPKASATANLPVPLTQQPSSDVPKFASDANQLTPHSQKSTPNNDTPSKTASGLLPSPSARALQDTSNPPASGSREQIPGLTYSNYSSWDEKEFVKAVRMFGNDPYKISDYLGTKTVGAVKMYFSRNKKRLGLENVATVRRNPYAEEQPATPEVSLPLLAMRHPIMATLKVTAATSPANLLNLQAMQAPNAMAPIPTPSTLVIAPLSPLPPNQPTSGADSLPPLQPLDGVQQAPGDRQTPTSAAQTVSLFQPAPGGASIPGGPRGDSQPHISDLLLQGDSYKSALPDLSSLFNLNAFQPGASLPGSPASSPATLLTSLPGFTSLGRTASASTPSLFTNQPFQPGSDNPAASHPARQASAPVGSEATTPRGSDDFAAAVPLAGPRRAASLWSSDEKDKFLDVYKRYGKVWQRLQEAIPTKSMAQIKTYYQNYKTKLGLDKMEVPQPVPRFEGGGKRRHGGGKGAAARGAHQQEGEEPVAQVPQAPVVQSPYLQEAARAWEAGKDALPSWPPLNVNDEDHPSKSAPLQPPSLLPQALHPQPSSLHTPNCCLPPTGPLTTHTSPFHNHCHPSPPPHTLPMPTRPESRESSLASLPILDTAQLAAATLSNANSGTMDNGGWERLDSMLAACIRALPEDSTMRHNLMQYQHGAVGHLGGGLGQGLAGGPEQQQQLSQQLLQQQLPPVMPLQQQILDDVRVLGQNLQLQTPVSAASSSALSRPPGALDLVSDRWEHLGPANNTTSALLALLQRSGVPLSALSPQPPMSPQPSLPISSAGLPRVPLLDAALSSLGLTSMLPSLSSAASADILAALQSTLLSSSRPPAHLPANHSAFSQLTPAAPESIPSASLHPNLPFQLLSSLGVPHGSTDSTSALLALVGSAQQGGAESLVGGLAGIMAAGAGTTAPPARVPTPKALDLHMDEVETEANARCGQAGGMVAPREAPQPRKITDLNVGLPDILAQSLPSSSAFTPVEPRGGRVSTPPVCGSPLGHSLDRDGVAGASLYFPPAKRARYHGVPGDATDDGTGPRMDMVREGNSAQQQHAAAAVAAAAGALGFQGAAAGPAAAHIQLLQQLAAAAGSSAAARDSSRPPSRQFMEAELARYMQTPFPELEVGGAASTGRGSLSHPEAWTENAASMPPASMLGFEPLRVLNMLSNVKQDMPGSTQLPSSAAAAAIPRHLTSLPVDCRLPISPADQLQLPFQGLTARVASPMPPASAAARAVPLATAGSTGVERLLSPDLLGMSSAAGLATVQLPDISAAASPAHLPQWLAGVAGSGMAANGMSHSPAGLDLNRAAPSPPLNGVPPAGVQQLPPSAGHAASPFPEQQQQPGH